MSRMFNRGNLLSALTARSGLAYLSRQLLNVLYPGHIRVINYHHVPLEQLPQFKLQIEYLLSIYDPATPEDLNQVLNGKNGRSQPKFILTFDDGFESHGTYVADYLKSKGISGWFFVPTAAPDLNPETQHQWAIDNHILKQHESATVNGRVFATWETWLELKQDHVIGSHTHNHLRFKPEVSESEAKEQLSLSYGRLHSELAQLKKIFCWVGGELTSYSPHAAKAIKSMETELAFTTCSAPVCSKTDPLRIERTNIESSFPVDRVKMAVSGIVDLRYYAKRKKLDLFFNHT